MFIIMVSFLIAFTHASLKETNSATSKKEDRVLNRRVFDCFVYDGEDDELTLKLKVMEKYVDYFIIT